MINFQTFLLGLLITSTLTGLATEAVKTIMTENNKPYRANTLAGIVSLILSTMIGIAYVVMAAIPFTTQVIVCIVALVFMSWLCAMVGYDKVIQAISQFKTGE
ncbi:MAG: aminopeptidase [Firmicutes bacterium]|nr:aminopeptidase [Bacillota bacterium]